MPPLLPPPLVSELLLLPPLRGNRAVCSGILFERQWRVGEQHGGHGWLPVAPLELLRWLLLLLRLLLPRLLLPRLLPLLLLLLLLLLSMLLLVMVLLPLVLPQRLLPLLLLLLPSPLLLPLLPPPEGPRVLLVLLSAA
jgi:hypothetical protein